MDSDFSTKIDDDGIWCEVLSEPPYHPAPALFLDRDGVVVEEVHYLHSVEDCRLIDGAADLIKAANDKGWYTIIVTNQAGIARGIFGWPDFNIVQKKIIADLAANGARIDAVFACPHHEKGTGAFHHPDHPARKPNAGMLTRAADRLPIDLEQSWIIGDRASDIGAGQKAGLRGGLQVKTGHGSRDGETEQSLALATGHYSVRAINSIKDALDIIDLDIIDPGP